MKKILILSEFFYPDKSSTPKVLTELAEDLVKNGLNVEIICSVHSYKGNRYLSKKETVNGIQINRIRSSNLNRNSKIGRMINYISFTVNLFIKLIFFNKYDSILVVSNPPLIPFIAYLNKRIKNKPYYYLVHDVYPDIAVEVGAIKKNSISYKLMNIINEVAIKNTEKLIVLGKDMKSVYLNKKVEAKKIEIITNWSKKYELNPQIDSNVFYQDRKLTNTFNIVYTGNIGRFHDIETIIKVAKKSLVELPNVRFIFVGDGFKRPMLENAIGNNISNIVIADYQYDACYEEVLSGANLFISTLSPRIKGLGVPSKTYSYLAAGKPIIAIMEKETEIGDLIEDEDLGLRADSMEVDTIINFIKEISSNETRLEEIHNNVSTIFNERYERQRVTEKFYNLLK
ncbi:glycosyltransferase family 4 protein [Exiguobacterium sp. UBA4551]|uniref:glycosyltransferase family 4 protein n=1 Tax=Exiguobacterium sp. UBA4551 TaxID=1946494 RepID=UPI002580C2D8|nr:glycosyltransferase family 4 protein [Exiguobacterium sp. UBA4551]